MSVIEAILMLCAVGVVMGVGSPLWLIWQRMTRSLTAVDVVLGVLVTAGGFFLPYAFFYLSDDWVQTSLRQYLESRF